MWRFVLLPMTWSVLFSPCAQAAPALPDRDAELTLGYANRKTTPDDPMRLVVYEKNPAKPSKLILHDVAVTDIPKYERPKLMAGETRRQYFLRVIQEQEAHSKLKAEKIAAAINTVVGMGRATVTQNTTLARSNTPAVRLQWNVLVPGDRQFTPIKNGQVTIQGGQNIVYGPSAALVKVRNADIKAARAHNRMNPRDPITVPKPLRNNHTGEVGDGVRIRNGKPIVPPSGSRYRGSMGSMNSDLQLEFPGEFPQLSMVASGLDDDGNSSVFEFGILDRYVASVNPIAGQTDEELYLTLKALLDSNGLPASYDSSGRTLTFVETFGPDDTLYWANNDTGFSEYLTVSYGVPEPSSLVLVVSAVIVLHLCRYRTRTN